MAKPIADVLVQTTIRPDLAKWVKRQAEREGISVAAWLRQLVMHRYALMTKIWK